MERVSYKAVKGFLKTWNDNHPEKQFELAAYCGYYHIKDADTHNNVIVEEHPGRLWESFCIWKDGYYEGRISMKNEVKNNG